MKAKQWVKDYVDFAMPLIMVVVALNLVDLLIDLPYAYNPKFYKPEISDFFTINAHLSIFIEYVNSDKLFWYSLMFVALALFLRLFTNKLKVNIEYTFYVILTYTVVSYFIDNKISKETLKMLAFIFVDGLIIFLIFVLLFRILKIFFTNFHIIKIISYIAISILGLLLLLMYYFEITSVLLIIKYIFLYVIIFLVSISIIYILIKKTETIIMPQDIEQFEIDTKQDFVNSMVDLQDTVDSMNEKRKIKNIIRDLIDYAKK